MPFLALMAVHAPPASATPAFVGPDDLVTHAEAVWPLLAECGGGDGPTAPVVHLNRDPDLDVVAHAILRGGLLRSIQFRDEDVSRGVVAHELAHAWVQSGDGPLREGFAELLAQCTGAGLRWRPQITVETSFFSWGATEMRGWEAYGQALMFAKAASTLIPERLLLEQRSPTWVWFWEELLARSPDEDLRRRLLFLYGSEYVHLDMDRDGLTVREEELLGTDPWRWDTDGDGWWDGYAGRRKGVPLAVSGAVRCVGRARRHDVVSPRVVGPLAGEGDLLVWRHEDPKSVPQEVQPRDCICLAWRQREPDGVGGVRVLRLPKTAGECAI